MKKILCAFITLISVGCARTPIIADVIYTPQLQEVARAEVGENMFSKVSAIFRFKNYVVLPNEDQRVKYKVRDSGNRFDELEGVKCALYNRSLSLLDYNCDGEFTHLRNGEELDKPVKYKLIPAPPSKILRDSFKREVVYQGKIGNKIKISFQEFYANNGVFMIRDSYTQNIEYELDSNGEALIGFKGIRIKVLSATNLTIKYKVLKDFK